MLLIIVMEIFKQLKVLIFTSINEIVLDYWVCIKKIAKSALTFKGVNGAGKTSTFKMLTGESSVSKGDAFIHGYSAINDWKRVQ